VTADEIFAAVLARELHERGIECSDIATLVTGVRLARQFVPPPVANDVAPVVTEVVANAAGVANAKPKRKRDRTAYMRRYMRRKRAAERAAP
jgi:hypothetical protein